MAFVLGLVFAILSEWAAVRVRRVAVKRTFVTADERAATRTTAGAGAGAASSTTATKDAVDGLTKSLHWLVWGIRLVAGGFWLAVAWPILTRLPDMAIAIIVIIVIVVGVIGLFVSLVEIRKDRKPDGPAWFMARLAIMIIVITWVYWPTFTGAVGALYDKNVAMVNDTKPVKIDIK